jgi:hypothetical protein
MNCKGMNDGDGNHNCSRMITLLDKLIEKGAEEKRKLQVLNEI